MLVFEFEELPELFTPDKDEEFPEWETDPPFEVLDEFPPVEVLEEFPPVADEVDLEPDLEPEVLLSGVVDGFSQT